MYSDQDKIEIISSIVRQAFAWRKKNDAIKGTETKIANIWGVRSIRQGNFYAWRPTVPTIVPHLSEAPVSYCAFGLVLMFAGITKAHGLKDATLEVFKPIGLTDTEASNFIDGWDTKFKANSSLENPFYIAGNSLRVELEILNGQREQEDHSG